MWLLVHFITCAFMTGLIWLVQLVHYPAFKSIEAQGFASFHRFHSSAIGCIVAPVMLMEMISGILLWAAAKDKLFFAVNGILLVLIWISTAFLSVPQHEALAAAKDPAVIEKLVVTNWPRTLLWTLRLVMLSLYLLPLFRQAGIR